MIRLNTCMLLLLRMQLRTAMLGVYCTCPYYGSCLVMSSMTLLRGCSRQHPRVTQLQAAAKIASYRYLHACSHAHAA
jgi:hypothetical protein